MHIIVAVVVIVLLAHWTGLSTWTVLFGLLGLFVILCVVFLAISARNQPVRTLQAGIARPHSRAQSAIGRATTPHIPVTYARASGSSTTIASGLIIRAEHLANILSGHKTWEMRAQPVRKREEIALIQQGAKVILGVAEIVDCLGPLTEADMLSNADKHLVERARLPDVTAKYRYAWVLANARRLTQPVPCPMKRGQQQFVSIPPETVNEIQRLL
jgi:hypothetical protein